MEVASNRWMVNKSWKILLNMKILYEKVDDGSGSRLEGHLLK